MYGLALGGGGSRGAYEVGVLQALAEMEIPIGAITGTSIGALNGAAYLMGDLEFLIKIWKSLDKDALIKFNPTNISDAIKNRGFSFNVLLDMMDQVLDEQKIRDNPIDFGVVTYNVTTREPVIIFKDDAPFGTLLEYVAASANHPSFERLVIDGDEYIDGAVYDNIPIHPLYKRGYQKIIAVNLHTVIDLKSLEGPYELIEISPRINLGSVMFPDPKTIEQNINLGYLDTLRAFKQLKGYTYYFRHLEDFSLLSSLSASEIKNLREDFRPLFLKGPLSRHENSLGPDHNNMLAALEITANELHIDTNKIYENQGELLDEVFDVIGKITHGKLKLNLMDSVIFRDLDQNAFTALGLASPNKAITNLFIKIMQNRIIGGEI